MQKTLVTITGEHKPEAIKNIDESNWIKVFL